MKQICSWFFPERSMCFHWSFVSAILSRAIYFYFNLQGLVSVPLGGRRSLRHQWGDQFSGFPSKEEDKTAKAAKYPGRAPLAFQDFLKLEIFSLIFLKSLSVTHSEDKLGHLKRGLVREQEVKEEGRRLFPSLLVRGARRGVMRHGKRANFGEKECLGLDS